MQTSPDFSPKSRCIGALTARKFLCDKDLVSCRGDPRCLRIVEHNGRETGRVMHDMARAGGSADSGDAPGYEDMIDHLGSRADILAFSRVRCLPLSGNVGSSEVPTCPPAQYPEPTSTLKHLRAGHARTCALDHKRQKG